MGPFSRHYDGLHLLLGSAILGTWITIGGATETPRYNVLYLIADDLRPEFLTAYGQDDMITPAVDKLARTGLVFENAYCQQAVCSPSRNSFMSGRRPAHTRIFDNGDGSFRSNGIDSAGILGSEWTTCPEHFKQSGWTTLGGGKTFHPGSPPNWDQPRSWSQDMDYFKYSYYIQPNTSYPSDQPCPQNTHNGGSSCASKIDTFCAIQEEDSHFYDFTLQQNTLQRLQYGAKHQPFFIESGFARPHAPWRVPQRFWDMYNTSNVYMPAHRFPPNGMPGIAWHQQGFYLKNGIVHCPNITLPIDYQTTLAMRHAYQAAVSWLDHQIGAVLDELDDLGLTSSTLVLFHGDHGWSLGEHNLWHKEVNFELGTRVPLIMRAPWMKNSIGKRSTMMVELIDIYPTIADLAGTPAPKDALDGVSLAPVFQNPTLETIPTNKGTQDKTVAFSQFPHDDFFDCPWFEETTGKCVSSPPEGYHVVQQGETYMGYAVRDKDWRFVAWLPFTSKNYSTNWDATPIFELYNHSTDRGSDFDSMDLDNVAYKSCNSALTEKYYNLTRYFFEVVAPPHSGGNSGIGNATECKAANGILHPGTNVCCAASCGECGGKGCESYPGGKTKCCQKEIENSGRSCATEKAPCIT